MSPRTARDAVLRYHARSIHQPNRFAPGPGGLDWATQPDPFRTYAGAPTAELPLAGDELTATWDDLHEPGTVAPRPLDRRAVGAFLELALGLTAWKEVGASRWSLRANPSSGNLHPTEGHVLLPRLPGVEPGLHHYVSRDHVLERRWAPAVDDEKTLSRILAGGFAVGLASIHWREAWKYGERAFRYCQHDAGHALATLRYAAGVLGWTARLLEAPGDDDVAALLGLDRDEDLGGLPTPDREHPDMIVAVAPATAIRGVSQRVEAGLDELVSLSRSGTWAGHPNPLSPSHVPWPEIDTVAAATRKPRTPPTAGATPRATALTRDAPFDPGRTRAVVLIRQRRSAVDMDGRTGLAATRFFQILDRLLPRPGGPPWDALPWSARVHPVLFVHRVDDLAPGIYVLVREEAALATLRRSARTDLQWTRPERTPDGLPLFLLEGGDARSFAGFASCRQAIASDSAFSLGMLGDFEASVDEGPWWYRRLLWEAGVLGQVLYMEAEAAGLRGTGIGCYFDDVVHEVLGLEDASFRDLYHFTVGGPVEDRRLATRPAYGGDVHLRSREEPDA